MVSDGRGPVTVVDERTKGCLATLTPPRRPVPSPATRGGGPASPADLLRLSSPAAQRSAGANVVSFESNLLSRIDPDTTFPLSLALFAPPPALLSLSLGDIEAEEGQREKSLRG